MRKGIHASIKGLRYREQECCVKTPRAFNKPGLKCSGGWALNGPSDQPLWGAKAVANTSSASSTPLPSCWWPAWGQLKTNRKSLGGTAGKICQSQTKDHCQTWAERNPALLRTAWLMFKGSRRDVGQIISDSTAGPMSTVTNALMIGQLSHPNPTPPHTHPSPHLLYGGWKPRGIPGIFPSPLASRPHSTGPQADPAKQISFCCSPLGTKGKEITKKSKDTAESPLHTQSMLLVLKQVK